MDQTCKAQRYLNVRQWQPFLSQGHFLCPPAPGDLDLSRRPRLRWPSDLVHADESQVGEPAACLHALDDSYTLPLTVSGLQQFKAPLTYR